MEKIDLAAIQKIYETVFQWLMTHVFVLSTLEQTGVSIFLFALAYALAKKPRAKLESFLLQRWPHPKFEQYNLGVFTSLVTPVMSLILLWIGGIVVVAIGLPNNVFAVIAKLMLAWVVIRFSSSLVRSIFWSKVIAAVAWVIAALSIVNLLDPTINFLEELALNIGHFKISALTIIKACIIFAALLWVAGAMSRLLERSIGRSSTLTPSIQVLLIKVTKFSLVAIALMIGLNSLGIDLTALTVFGGAIGLGLGFGLQKVISNLVCGLILLLDRSVKPGDVIEVGSSYGWVNSLSARYVSVLTRDGVEHLIPNEYLITEKVVNWSYSDPKVRVKIPVGIAYDADVKKAMEVILNVAEEHRRILKIPAPVCQLNNFGDSSINLELRIWIRDPANGVNNVKSDVLVGIWEKFKEEGVAIPFPQRDVHIKVSKELEELIKSARQDA